MERPPGVHKCRTPLGCPAQSCWGLAAQVLHDVGHERAEGDAAVADRILLLGAHLRGRDLEAIGYEDRVVAETTLASRGTCQGGHAPRRAG